ncbi:alpha/beta fold hydrolase [Streptomyces sp. PTD5-9]|uniref:alpha/beta fold hydrolase n=1 Tax=Streptomyces sp. PTD5-9 TaxID=3120150 RepID=UPI00300B584A
MIAYDRRGFGRSNHILPIEATGARTHEMIKGAHYVTIEGAGHGLCWTHAEEVIEHLLKFLA